MFCLSVFSTPLASRPHESYTYFAFNLLIALMSTYNIRWQTRSRFTRSPKQ